MAEAKSTKSFNSLINASTILEVLNYAIYGIPLLEIIFNIFKCEITNCTVLNFRRQLE